MKGIKKEKNTSANKLHKNLQCSLLLVIVKENWKMLSQEFDWQSFLQQQWWQQQHDNANRHSNTVVVKSIYDGLGWAHGRNSTVRVEGKEKRKERKKEGQSGKRQCRNDESLYKCGRRVDAEIIKLREKIRKKKKQTSWDMIDQ